MVIVTTWGQQREVPDWLSDKEFRDFDTSKNLATKFNKKMRKK